MVEEGNDGTRLEKTVVRGKSGERKSNALFRVEDALRKESKMESERIQVFLRVKPSGEGGASSTLSVRSEDSVETIVPKDSQAAKNREENALFTFSKVFPEDQADVFTVA